MKKEFEAYRSRIYSYIFLSLSILFFIIGVFFSIMWIEWSLSVIIIAFVLFLLAMALFVIMFLKQDVVIEITKDKMTVFKNPVKEYKLSEVEAITIDNNKFSLKMIIKSNSFEDDVEIFVSNLNQKREELINVLKNLETKVYYTSNIKK